MDASDLGWRQLHDWTWLAALRKCVGCILMSLLATAISAQAAVNIVAVASQQDRLEGESVEVTAAIRWDSLPIKVSPLVRVTRTVRAVVTPRPISLPVVPTEIDLLFDPATSLYRGRFPGLPFANYQTTITATQTIRDATVFPTRTSTTQAVATTEFGVHSPPAGCFDFDRGPLLQGWTAAGPFDGDAMEDLARETLALTWLSNAGFQSPGARDRDGGLVMLAPASLFPSDPASFESGFYRLDLISPPLDNDIAWQAIKGFSFRIRHNLVGVQVQPLLLLRKPNGTTVFFRQLDETGRPVFLSMPSQEYHAGIANIAPPAGHQVLAVQLRIFGPAGLVVGQESFVSLDGVCPMK